MLRREMSAQSTRVRNVGRELQLLSPPAHIRDEKLLNHLQSTYLKLRISTRSDLADASGVDA